MATTIQPTNNTQKERLFDPNSKMRYGLRVDRITGFALTQKSINLADIDDEGVQEFRSLIEWQTTDEFGLNRYLGTEQYQDQFFAAYAGWCEASGRTPLTFKNMAFDWVLSIAVDGGDTVEFIIKEQDVDSLSNQFDEALAHTLLIIPFTYQYK